MYRPSNWLLKKGAVSPGDTIGAGNAAHHLIGHKTPRVPPTAKDTSKCGLLWRAPKAHDYCKPLWIPVNIDELSLKLGDCYERAS